MNRAIGKELITLTQTIQHLSAMEGYYNAVIERDGDLTQLSDHEDHSLRFYAVQHLGHFDQVNTDEDLEDHYLGFGMDVVKRNRILDILSDKESFLEVICDITKQRIIGHLPPHVNTFDGLAEFEFLGSERKAFFDVEVDRYGLIKVRNAFVGKHENDIENHFRRDVEHMIDFQF